MNEPTTISKPRWRDDAPSWGMSLLVHAILIGLMAMIGWTIVRHTPPPVVIELGEATTPDRGFATGRSGNSASAASAASAAAMTSPSAAIELPAPPLAAVAPLPLPTPQITPATPTPASSIGEAMLGVLDSIAPVGGDGEAAGAQGNLDGPGEGLGDAIAGMRGAGLDVVFVLDATESMAPYIEQSKQRIRQIISVVEGMIGTDLPASKRPRFGVVAFKDYGDDYGVEAVRFESLTGDAKAIQRFLDDVHAGGGGDVPEPIHQALRYATGSKMGWRKGSRSVIVLVGDAPVHLLNRRDVVVVSETFARKQRGMINVIDVGGAGGGDRVRNAVLMDFAEIAKAGRGTAHLLRQDQEFWRDLIVSIFGRQFEKDVQAIVSKYIME